MRVANEMTQKEIEARLEKRPELMQRFLAGDLEVLSELVEVGTGAKVLHSGIRSLA